MWNQKADICDKTGSMMQFLSKNCSFQSFKLKPATFVFTFIAQEAHFDIGENNETMHLQFCCVFLAKGIMVDSAYGSESVDMEKSAESEPQKPALLETTKLSPTQELSPGNEPPSGQ